MAEIPNPLYARKVEYLTRSLIEQQSMYAKGLIKISPDGKSLINTITGTSYETLKEAQESIAEMGISRLEIFGGEYGAFTTDNPQFGQLSDFVSNINEYLSLPRTDTGQYGQEAAEYIAKSPLLQSLSDKKLELLRISYSNTSETTIQDIALLYDQQIDDLGRSVSQELAEGRIAPPGFLSTREGQAVLLRLRYMEDGAYKYLTGEETLELFTRLNAQAFNIESVIKAIPNDIGKDAELGIASLFGKSSKRLTASLSDRNFMMRQQDVGMLVEHLRRQTDPRFALSAPKTFEQSFLQFDPSFETALRAYNLEESYTESLLSNPNLDDVARNEILRKREATRVVMSAQTQESANYYFRSMLEAQGLSESEIFEFDSLMREQLRLSFDEGTKASLNNVMANITERIDSIDDGVSDSIQIKAKYRKFRNALDEMKKIDDGSGFVTGIPFRQHAENLRAKINQIDNQLKFIKPDDSRLAHLTRNRQMFQSELERIESSPGVLRKFQDQTARLLLGRGQIKTVLDLQTEFEDALARLGYFGAGSTELFKKEISFGRIDAPGSGAIPNIGQQFTMNISIGGSSDLVYSEPQALIFHRAMYGPEFREQALEASRNLEKEVENVMSGRVSERLKGIVSRGASIDVEGMDVDDLIERFGSKANAIRYRNNMRDLQQALLSGETRVNDIPELANRLIDVAQREVYKDTKTYSMYIGGDVKQFPIYNIVLPQAQRSAVDTEGRVSRGTGMRILGGSEETTYSRFMTEGGQDLSMFKYRYNDHKIIFPDQAATSMGLYEAGGGFDLDDKFITNLRYIKDSEGNRRLVSFAWRQPTGPQEFALMSPYLDDETIERMFGGDTQMGIKFRSLADAASNEINTRTGFNLRLSGNLKNQLTAEGLESLSREDKIIKYLNSLAHGQKDVARLYKQSAGDITQEELERAIFKLVNPARRRRVYKSAPSTSCR